nr:ras association domain-containing protein 10 [Pogona vitticeps]
MLSGPPQSYCIVEKWRGFERILPNKTKILRLWTAWGDEQENVRFVLVRSEASLPNAGPRSAEARVVPSKESPAFRKLAKINKRKGQPPSPPPPPPPPDQEGSPSAKEAAPAAERMETLVHLVLSQDHTIRQQIKRIRDLDREIDRYEARTHLDRMRRHGVNYVQDTYLDGGDAEPSGEGDEEEEGPAAAPANGGGGEDLAEYARQCEQVALLQDQWRRQEELGSRTSLAEADCNTTELVGGSGGELHVEQERVKTQLSTSLYIGLRLSTDLDAVKADLEGTRRAWEEKERELQALLDTLRALEVAEANEEGGPPPLGEGSGLPQPAPSPSEGWAEPEARTLCKDSEENDEDSDTGLSSMHSQDSDSVPVCESLV